MTISCQLPDIHDIHCSRRTQCPLIFSCFLFGYLNNRFQGQQFGSADELLSGVRKILDEISVDTLEAVFREYVDQEIGPMPCSLAALQPCSNRKANGMKSAMAH
jgi:hypothetical protein